MTQTKDTEKCEAGCSNGYVPCPNHTVSDGDPKVPFCVECDQPMDEKNTKVNCEECF